MAKKTKKVSEDNETSKKKHKSNYSKNKGNKYEQQIAKELRELGFSGVKTSRSESKELDNNKVDIIDTNKKLPFNIQLKKTLVCPQYFKIRSESTVDPESFIMFWAKQEKKQTNICTVGECVIMDKKTFYELIKPYANE